MGSEAAALKIDRVSMRFVPSFRKAIKAEKNRYIDAQVNHWRIKGRLSDELDLEHAQRMASIFKTFYGRVMKPVVQIAPLTIDGLKSSFVFERKAKEQTHDRALRLWFERVGGKRAKAVAQTTRDDISRLMVEAFDAGEPEAVVLKRGLMAKGFSAFRADTIARTETHGAAQFASRVTAETIAREANITIEKAWLPTQDDRTREAHADMDADNFIPLDQAFDVGGEAMDRPADPTASAENIINCRCQEIRRVV